MIKIEVIKQKHKGERNFEVMLKVTTDEPIIANSTQQYFSDIANDMKVSLEKAEKIMGALDELLKGGDSNEKHD